MEANLPDDARVVAISSLGERTHMTLGEACERWKDSRHFCIDAALLRTGEYRAQGLTIRLLEFKSGPWMIRFDPPPIPVRDMDWDFTHDNYDASYEGPEDGWVSNGLAGRDASPQACLSHIADMDAEAA